MPITLRKHDILTPQEPHGYSVEVVCDGQCDPDHSCRFTDGATWALHAFQNKDSAALAEILAAHKPWHVVMFGGEEHGDHAHPPHLAVFCSLTCLGRWTVDRLSEEPSAAEMAATSDLPGWHYTMGIELAELGRKHIRASKRSVSASPPADMVCRLCGSTVAVLRIVSGSVYHCSDVAACMERQLGRARGEHQS